MRASLNKEMAWSVSPSAMCNVTIDGNFACLCTMGWKGIHCQTKINHCEASSCLNKGVCRPAVGNYTCECLGSSYFGRHCEITSSQTALRKIISRSLVFVAITAMSSVVTFVIVLDVLKYRFGIDVAPLPRRRLARRRRKAKSHAYMRFVYVNPPVESSIAHETVVL
jgi:hypothetical protein